MIRSRIVEINGAFDETQTQKSHIKIEVPLRIARDSGHMVKSANLVIHQTRSRSCRSSRAGPFGMESDCGDNGKDNEQRQHHKLSELEWRLGLRWSHRFQGGHFFERLHDP